MLYIIV